MTPNQGKSNRIETNLTNYKMDFKQFTIKSQEAIQKAAELAMAEQQQAIEPAHILKGIFSEDENVTDFLFKKLNVNKGLIAQKTDDIIRS